MDGVQCGIHSVVVTCRIFTGSGRPTLSEEGCPWVPSNTFKGLNFKGIRQFSTCGSAGGLASLGTDAPDPWRAVQTVSCSDCWQAGTPRPSS
jgi:hypothetical protein